MATEGAAVRPPHAKTRGSTTRAAVAGIALAACLLVVCAAGAAAGGSDASFAAGPPLPVGSSPGSVAAADFDANGAVDLAIGNLGYRNDLRILLNDGSGGLRLAAGSPFKVGTYPLSVVGADFDGDGSPDLAVGGKDVRILLNDHAARFRAAPESPV